MDLISSAGCTGRLRLSTGSLDQKLSSAEAHQFDGVDDTLSVLFPALGSNYHRAESRRVKSVDSRQADHFAAGARVITANFSRYFVINRALTSPETDILTAWLAEGAL